jgi:thiaminase
MSSPYQNLETLVSNKWKEIFARSPFIKNIQAGEFDKYLYQMYMIETYHYTAHNARNQALVGVFGKNMPVNYQKFVFHHACEETGHELMAFHDVNSTMQKPLDIQKLPVPLVGTEAVVGYLYWISLSGNLLARLGYSFWAENCYQYINPLVGKMKEKLELKNSQLTFFVAHSDIDDEHAKEVKEMIEKYATTQEDWNAITDVAVKSLELTGRMLDDVWSEYVKFKTNPSESRYKNYLS